jgi:FixJ family two-component response regulator
VDRRHVSDLVKAKPSLKDLARTERIILTLISENKTSKYIAAELSVSYPTVENHRSNIGSVRFLGHGAALNICRCLPPQNLTLIGERIG